MSDLYLVHHGIKGQKWGVRRFQNDDGSLTPAGKSRYYNSDGSLTRAGKRRQALRDDYIKRNTERVEKLQYEQQQAKRTLQDYKKNGTHGSAFKDEYGNYSDSDFEDRYGFTKKEALDASIRESRAELEKANLAAKDIKAIREDMKKVMNTSLDDESYVEASNRHATIALGIMGSAAVAGVTIQSLTQGTGNELVGSIVGLGVSLLGGIGAGVYAGASANKDAKKHNMSGKT